jgi:SAM-dependent methyltransferase
MRRTALHRQLGITRNNIRGRRVIEFGPGPGDNAMHVAHFEPAKTTLVDGNPASIRALEEKRSSGLLGTACDVVQSNIIDYRSDEKYDLVICEGVLTGQVAPEEFLAHVASFVDEGGVLSITTIGAESYLSETCRRALLPLIRSGSSGDSETLARAVAFFKPDLDGLPGMTRRHEDWVLDNILHPWTEFGVFSADQAISALMEEFSLLGCSPRFLQDWRWYKHAGVDHRTNAAMFLGEYRKWVIYLLDYRSLPTTTAEHLADDVNRLSFECLHAHDRIPSEAKASDYEAFVVPLAQLGELIAGVLPETSKAIADYLTGLRAMLAGNREPDFGAFRSWFGRGQQYMSFVRD